MKKMEESIVDAHILIKDHNKFLDQLSTSNHNLEDTVLNVLLAIRQNEYLQAWYPAQHGYDAMKLVGSHPAKTNGSLNVSENRTKDRQFGQDTSDHH